MPSEQVSAYWFTATTRLKGNSLYIKGHVKSEAFEKIIQQPEKYIQSVLAYTPMITEVMEQQTCISLSQQHYRSEGALLALMVAKQTGLGIDFVASNQSLIRAGYFMASDDHEDHLLAVRDMLRKEGINILEL